MPTPEGSLLDPSRVAFLVGISKRTLSTWVKRGYFPAPFRLGSHGRTLRWTPTQVMNHLKATVKPPGDSPSSPTP